VAVLAVQSGSPARAAGLQPGDVILSVDGKPVATAEDLIGILRQRKPGDRMAVTYARGSTQKAVTVTLSARPES
jgi:putative serine protease PepD